LTERTLDAAQGKSLPEVFPIYNEETRQPVENPVAKVLRTGTVAGLATHTVLVTKEGREIPIDDSAAPIRDEQGRLLGIILVFQDITARRQAENALRESEQRWHTLAVELQRVNEELQQFAYIVSHDLKEPLSNIAHLVTFLAEDYQDQLDAQANAYITRTIAATQRLHQMLNDLLSYTQVGGRDFAFDSVDCEAVLMTVLEDLAVTIAERDATITHDPLPTVGGEATHLGQVLQNLIGNALKFCGQESPRIHVSVQRDGTHWRFGVRDNGIGIAPHQAPRLFQVFQRLHTRSEYPGTGIGLAICKKIVERHGGRIWVESAPGQGATFFFTLRDF
jgi:PAS domain S-box-containing protein